MPYSVKGFFEINEDMVQTLLVLEVLFTQDSEVENLFCGASSGSEPACSYWGGSGGTMVLGNLPVPGCPTYFD